MALKYLPECKHETRIVNHKDCNKENNLIKNLEWSTVSHNTQHGFDNMRYKCIDPVLVTDTEGKRHYFKTGSRALRYFNIPIGNLVSIFKSGVYYKLNLKFERVEKCNDYPFVE